MTTMAVELGREDISEAKQSNISLCIAIWVLLSPVRNPREYNQAAAVPSSRYPSPRLDIKVVQGVSNQSSIWTAVRGQQGAEVEHLFNVLTYRLSLTKLADLFVEISALAASGTQSQRTAGHCDSSTSVRT